MTRILKSGSIVSIPLLKGFGFSFAKYVDLSRIKKDVVFPDVIKVYNLRRSAESVIGDLNSIRYLLSPIAVAGLRPTLKSGAWKILSESNLQTPDNSLPDFKGGNLSYEEIEKGEWYVHKNCEVNRLKMDYEKVKYLQPFTALSTMNIELRLTMYHILNEGLKVSEYFDLAEDRNSWNYKQVLDSPSLLM